MTGSFYRMMGRDVTWASRGVLLKLLVVVFTLKGLLSAGLEVALELLTEPKNLIIFLTLSSMF